jgi:hypothetical protein
MAGRAQANVDLVPTSRRQAEGFEECGHAVYPAQRYMEALAYLGHRLFGEVTELGLRILQNTHEHAVIVIMTGKNALYLALEFPCGNFHAALLLISS